MSGTHLTLCVRGIGIAGLTEQARVGEIIDERTFKSGGGRGVPLPRRRSARYEGWSMVWISGGALQGPVSMGPFDRETDQFSLTTPTPLKVGDMFEVYPPSANWNLHDNTITGCQTPVSLTIWGSPTTVFRNNIVDRGEASGVTQALLLTGRCDLIGNRFSGFNEPDSAAVSLQPNRLDKPSPNLLRDNVFTDCATPVSQSRDGLWAEGVGMGRSGAHRCRRLMARCSP